MDPLAGEVGRIVYDGGGRHEGGAQRSIKKKLFETPVLQGAKCHGFHKVLQLDGCQI